MEHIFILLEVAINWMLHQCEGRLNFFFGVCGWITILLLTLTWDHPVQTIHEKMKFAFTIIFCNRPLRFSLAWRICSDMSSPSASDDVTSDDAVMLYSLSTSSSICNSHFGNEWIISYDVTSDDGVMLQSLSTPSSICSYHLDIEWIISYDVTADDAVMLYLLSISSSICSNYLDIGWIISHNITDDDTVLCRSSPLALPATITLTLGGLSHIISQMMTRCYVALHLFLYLQQSSWHWVDYFT